MNTLNYIGCKHKLFPALFSIFEKEIPDLKDKTFSDLFMGTGTISYHMIDKCKSIFANDLETYSYIIGNALLKCNYNEKLEKIIRECNELKEVKGLIYKYYSPHSECERMFFTNSNASKADAIRIHLNQMLSEKVIDLLEFYFLVASLLVSIDKVANTTCVYGAYLKSFKPSSLKQMKLEPIHQLTHIHTNNEVSQGFAEQIEQKSDVTYLDPPYNQRSYSSNYFVLNFIAKYDETIIPKGKTGLFDKNQSHFCSKVKSKQAFETLLQNISTHYIILSYNNEGLLSENDVRDILLKKGSVRLYKLKYNKFKAQKNVKVNFVSEFLWVVDTQKTSEFTIV